MNRIKRTNIKAFTIFELLITMVVTSLLVTLVISMFFRFNEFFLLRKKQWGDNTEVLRFIKTLGDDIDRSESVSFKEQSLSITYEEKSSITYIYRDSEIIRISELETDTFFVNYKIQEINNLDSNTNIVDKIVLSSTIPDNTVFSLHLRKMYSKGLKFRYEKGFGISSDYVYVSNN